MVVYDCHLEDYGRNSDGVGEHQFTYDFQAEPVVGDTINVSHDKDKPNVYRVARRHWRADGSVVLIVARRSGNVVPAVRGA